MTSPCQQILKVLNQNLPDLDDTLRDIQHLLGLHLLHILSKACLREEAFVYAQADSEEILLAETAAETAEGWELLARWRVWLVHWGRFQDELAGDLDADEILSFEELGLSSS